MDRLEEDRLRRAEAQSALDELPANVVAIWQYAFTEMANSAIDHSCGKKVTTVIEKNLLLVEVRVCDEGVGISRKTKESFNLEDERHAILELAKGKLTTDPDSHTGEGIFFTSRTLDDFAIFSGNACFSHDQTQDEGWMLAAAGRTRGTSVFMRLKSDSRKTTQEVFDRFSAGQTHD